MPNVPPCTGPDTLLGFGSSLPSGVFHIDIAPPLAANQCIYAYDTCNDLVGAPACARPPAPVPALSPYALLAALSTLIAAALVALGRLRRAD
jgi:hypothetical protein